MRYLKVYVAYDKEEKMWFINYTYKHHTFEFEYIGSDSLQAINKYIKTYLRLQPFYNKYSPFRV